MAIVDGVPFAQNKVLHKISFSGAELPTQWRATGESVAQPEDPVRIGSVFLGWYITATGRVPFDFDLPVMGAKTIYGRWLTPGTETALRLPAWLRAIEDGAFEGIAADAVILPPEVVSIADSAFANSNVRYVFGIPGSAAEDFAKDHAYLTFVPVDADWLSSH